MGKNCQIYPGAVVGAVPQDLKFDGEVTSVELGDNVTVRECATINRGTKASGKYVTKIGNDTLIMSYSHVAHDCVIGDHCILVSYVGLAGETQIDDWAIIGGGAKAHQFTKVGCHAMVGGMSKINKDIPPYCMAARYPIAYEGVNKVGLHRRGYTSEQIDAIADVYRTIYDSGLNITQSLEAVEKLPASPERDVIMNFVRASKRGIVRKP